MSERMTDTSASQDNNYRLNATGVNVSTAILEEDRFDRGDARSPLMLSPTSGGSYNRMKYYSALKTGY